MPTIAEAVRDDGRFTTLITLLNLVGLVATLDGPGPFTVFAPTDDAFAGERDSLSNKVSLIFEVYKDNPTYWLIALIALHWDELSKDARDVFWDETKKFLSQDDTSLVNPLGYALAVDFFEDGRKLDEAWNALVRNSPNKQLLERVLKFSEPVPSSYVDKLRTRLKGLH